MHAVKSLLPGLLTFGLIASAAAAPADATTLLRQGLDELVATNRTVVLGEVVDATSYWNAEGTFILTDVRVAIDETLKGSPKEALTITLMGGSVGDLTTLIVGGAELIPGRSYLLFVDESDLPGAPRALTVPDHVQGAFDLVAVGGGLRAVSQAAGHPLVPDARGIAEPPGGTRGLALETIVRSIRERAAGAAERRK